MSVLSLIWVLALGQADGGDDAPAVPAAVEEAPPADASAELELFQLEEELEQKVTTASAGGKAEDRALAPANVVVITRDDIINNGWTSVGQALQAVPGLYVIEDLVIPSLGVRGVTGGLRAGTRIVKVMINSVAVNYRPDLTAFLGPEYLPIEAVERIEVVRGPLSALYGANAFLATVNIITVTHPAGSGLHAQLSGRGFLVNNTRPGGGAGGFVSYAGERLSVLAAVHGQRLDRSGLSVARTFPGQDPTLDRYRPFFAGPSVDDVSTPSSVFAQVAHQGSALGRVTLQGGMQSLDAVGEFQLSSVLTHQSRHSILNSWAHARHEKQWHKRFSTNAWVGVSGGGPSRDTRLLLTGNNQVAYRPNQSYLAVDFGLEGHLNILDLFDVAVGADASIEQHRILTYTEIRSPADQVERTGPDVQRNQTMRDVGTYLQLGFSPVASLRFTGNVRADFISYGPSGPPTQLSWRLAAAWKPTDSLVAKVIVGHAFQAPSATLLFAQPGFGSNNNVVGSFTASPTTVLAPQRVLSAEGVVTARLFSALSLDAAVFFQQVSDVIEFTQIATDFVPRNRGERLLLGAELVLNARIKRFQPFGFVSGQGTIGGTQGFLDPPPLFPTASFGAGLTVDVPEVFLSATARVRGASRRGASQSNVLLNNDRPYALDAYALVDLSLRTKGLEPLGPGRETRLQVTVRNLLDTRWSEPGFGGLDIPMLGRTFMLELTQSF